MDNIYLVRHLKTKYNTNGVYMGRRIDPPVIPSGIGHFEATLEKTGIGDLKRGVVILSSPAKRCLQTAETIRRYTCPDAVIKTEKAFIETDYGRFEGLNATQIRKEYPHLIDTWMYHPSRITFPEGESFVQVQKRAYRRFSEIAHSEAGTVVIVTHVDVIKLIVAKALQMPIDSKRYFKIDNGSITCLERIENEIRVKYLNVT